MTAKLLTDDELERRLTTARDAERRACARVARLKRAGSAAARRAEMQRLCVLGRAVMAWSSADERVMHALRRHLVGYVTRDTDRDVLRGTSWETPAPEVVRDDA